MLRDQGQIFAFQFHIFNMIFFLTKRYQNIEDLFFIHDTFKHYSIRKIRYAWRGFTTI